MLVFTKNEMSLISKLNTPKKVQDFLNGIPFNFEENGIDTIKSPIRVLRENNAHCFEGALLGAFILSEHDFLPLILHLKTRKSDFDHIVTPFKIKGLWGALSKTNHSVLRYREPVYKNIRELVMSYFHEYFLDNGEKTLLSYSRPLNLNIFKKGWEREEKDLWKIDEELDKVKHYTIAPSKVLKNLRMADEIEIKAGKIIEYQRPSSIK
ncbi:MAG: hypothetical protein WCX79_01775 [Candidatus Paceibacterota bacterium]|jgi:hypothetical protein